MKKSVIIIGSGMGGMAAGIYGQINGFQTRIYEMHSIPGGQCTSWKRKGYTFDACIHHLMGCSPSLKINQLWSELGAMPQDLVYTKECVSVISSDGKTFNDYYDLNKLEEHMLELAPQDKKAIKDYINGIKLFTEFDLMGSLMLGNTSDILKLTPKLLQAIKWMKTSMADYAKRFSNPLLQKAFPLLEYSISDCPFLLHLAKHASGSNKDIAWPIGGSITLSNSMAKRYVELGGDIQYNKKVTKIITKDGAAIGVKFQDGSEDFADIIISNADGRKTLLELLDGTYMNKQLKEYCTEPNDETNWAVHIFLGVDRDLSNEPSSVVMLLDTPVTIAGHENQSIEMQIYSFDKTMAPDGKGVIKVELVSKYSYWKELYQNKSQYEAEKQKVTSQVINLLGNHFHGITEQIEIVDVPTLMTWERFMGGTHGFCNSPNKKLDIIGSMLKCKDMLVPGLDNFYFVGAWATSTGALFANALSGKRAMQHICKKNKIKFLVQ